MKPLLLAMLLSLAACGTAADQMTLMDDSGTDPPSTHDIAPFNPVGFDHVIDEPAPVPPTIKSDKGDGSDMRISSPTASPTIDPMAVKLWNATVTVNSLPYEQYNPGPAMMAFRIVADWRGWNARDIEAWAPFVQAVMRRESHFCPAVFYGQHARADCAPYGRRRGTAVGFGQVIFRTVPYICPNEGLCSPWDIAASPWNSMTALVSLIEHSGRQPWCYTAKLRRGAVCRSAP